MSGFTHQDTSAVPLSDSLQWDEFCDLLGGAGWDEIHARWRVAGLSTEQEAAAPLLASRFGNAQQFLFEHKEHSLLVEVFWLKLNLFKALCRQVLVVHRDHRRPHLALDPMHARIRLVSPLACWSPARWLFSIEIAQPTGALPCLDKAIPPEMAQSLYTPPSNAASAFMTPLMQEWPFGREVRATILVRSMDRLHEDETATVRGMLRVHVISDQIVGGGFSERDVFRLTLGLPHGESDPVQLWARKVDVVERGIVVSGVTDPLPPVLWDRLQRDRRAVFSESRAAVYRSFHVPCDIYSLGMLLIRALLVNKTRNFRQVQEAVHKVAKSLDPIVQGIEPDDDWTAHQRLSLRLQEEGRVFGISSVMYDENVRPPSEATGTGDVWYDALILALKLVSWIPRFSVCGSVGDYNNTHVNIHLERVLGEAERLAERLRIELFEANERNRKVEQACARVMAELTSVGNR